MAGGDACVVVLPGVRIGRAWAQPNITRPLAWKWVRFRTVQRAWRTYRADMTNCLTCAEGAQGQRVGSVSRDGAVRLPHAAQGERKAKAAAGSTVGARRIIVKVSETFVLGCGR